jgi:hypothetical protein
MWNCLILLAVSHVNGSKEPHAACEKQSGDICHNVSRMTGIQRQMNLRLWPNSSYYPGVCLEGLMKITETYRQNSLYSS